MYLNGTYLKCSADEEIVSFKAFMVGLGGGGDHRLSLVIQAKDLLEKRSFGRVQYCVRSDQGIPNCHWTHHSGLIILYEMIVSQVQMA